MGNASYTLTTAPIPIPVDGDPQSLARHRARVAQPALRQASFCAGCHRGFLTSETGHPVHLPGLDEVSPWRHSAYAGSRAERIDEGVEARGCVDCHMPAVAGAKPYRSHRFAGGHSSFAAMIHADDQLDAIAAGLANAATLDVMLLERRPDGVRAQLGTGPTASSKEAEAGGSPGIAAPGAPTGPILFDVVLFNQGVGHRFPGGAKDLRDTWLEVSIVDGAGRVLASAGRDHVSQHEDPGAHRLHAMMTDDKGGAVTDHFVSHFRTPVYDHSIGPRDAGVARYEWIPGDGWDAAAGPVRIDARLKHRRLSLPFQEAVCAEAKTPRGRAFLKTTQRRWGVRPDACLSQPVLDIASAELAIDARQGTALGGPPTWMRLYRHGQALERHVQERLEESRSSLEAALVRLPSAAVAADWAMILLELGRVTGRQGRLEEAIGLLEEASRLAPDYSAPAYARGEAFGLVWRWDQAAQALTAAVKGAPTDADGWRKLAVALGGSMRPSEALAAARSGLLLEPRDASLLRTQMLAMRMLAPEDPRTTLAAQTWAAFRPDDDAPGVRSACSAGSDLCRQERRPVHVHQLK